MARTLLSACGQRIAPKQWPTEPDAATLAVRGRECPHILNALSAAGGERPFKPAYSENEVGGINEHINLVPLRALNQVHTP